MARGARVEGRHHLTFEDVELRTLGADSREMGLRGGDALGQLLCDGSGRAARGRCLLCMCVELAPLVQGGQRTDEVIGRAGALPVGAGVLASLLLVMRVVLPPRRDRAAPLRHRRNHGASRRPWPLRLWPQRPGRPLPRGKLQKSRRRMGGSSQRAARHLAWVIPTRVLPCG